MIMIEVLGRGGVKAKMVSITGGGFYDSRVGNVACTHGEGILKKLEVCQEEISQL